MNFLGRIIPEIFTALDRSNSVLANRCPSVATQRRAVLEPLATV